jgi:cysteine desulfurase family protein (TIGR01976 family)
LQDDQTAFGLPGNSSPDAGRGSFDRVAGLDAIGRQTVRAEFPALARRHEGRPYVYLDGPGGTQVPRRTIDAICAYLERSNANHEGAFPTSEESDSILAEAHAAAADFIGAASPSEIAFGANMTTLTFAFSRAIGRTLRAGDEIVVTRLDHDANVAPWLAVAEDRGAVIRWVGIRPTDCTLDLEEMARSIGPRTRLVAVGLASNAVGTINPVERVIEMAHEAGAWVYLDAVHAAPHMPLDVAGLDVDFLVCSPYKFFGPHLGMLYGRRDLLDRLDAYKVRPAANESPGKWETGTQSGEALAGLLGTFEYLEWLGLTFGGANRAGTRKARLSAAMQVIRETERDLELRALTAFDGVPGLRLRGIVDPARVGERVPTFAFTLDGRSPREVAARLGQMGIAVWDGDYYAYELIRALGLGESGGMVRVGLTHYNEPAEIHRLAEALRELS